MSDAPADPTEPEPPPRTFQFKPTEFERTNRPLGEPGDTGSIDLRDLYQQANAASAEPLFPPPPPALNDVHAILRANLDHANKAGFNDLVLKEKRMSRRNREYWTLLILGDALFALLVPVLHLGLTSVGTLFCSAGIICYSVCLTWIMRFVMDDY